MAYPSAVVEALKYCRKWLEQAILHYMQKELRICISTTLLRIEISVLDFLKAIIIMLHTV